MTNATHITDLDGQYQDTTVHGTITDGYCDNTGHDLTNTNGDESGIENGKQTDDAITKTTDSKVNSGQQVDDATTVEDNLKKDNGSDTYENKEFGKIGVMTYQEMQMKWRESFLNIDMQIINELSDLFMKVW